MNNKVVITTRIPLPLMVFLKSVCKTKRIRLETFFEQSVIAGLQKLGYEVPPELLDEEKVEPSGTLMKV